ncbi:MAG: type II secretion system protein [Verrucomicrobiae bacterium]|nr:type II secretion system protein [Verrucomicrobiae bacterium]
MKRQGGFTLTEILVATGLLMVVTSLLFTIFGIASDAWVNGERSVASSQSVRLTLEMMNREISNAYIAGGGSPAPGFVGTNNWLYFVAPVSRNKRHISEFGEFFYVFEDENNGRLCRYYNAPFYGNNQWNIYRSNLVSHSHLPESLFAVKSELCGCLLDLKFYYYDATNGMHECWNSTAAGKERGKLPVVVEVVMAYRPPQTAGGRRLSPADTCARTNTMVIKLFNQP